jgi:hypothetical protein
MKSKLLRRQRSGGWRFKASPNGSENSISINKPSVVAFAWDPSYEGGIGKSIVTV